MEKSDINSVVRKHLLKARIGLRKAWRLTCKGAKEAWRLTRVGLRKAWQWYKGLYRNAPWYKKTFVAIISLIVAFILYLMAVSVNLFYLFGKSPTIHEIMNPENNEASLLYSADGELLGKYFSENRIPVEYEQISPHFIRALIDTEDERFYYHHGIDFEGLAASFKDMLRGNSRGASTITQQLVKNMFRVRTNYGTGLLGKIPGLKIVIMKSKEWLLATEIEMFYSKKEILTMYANTVDFGCNSFGISTAARTYYNTSPDSLTIDQAAVLVGVLKATSYYNPKLNPEHSLKRRNVVLSNMLRLGDINKAQYDSLSAKELNLKFRVEKAYDGKALYFRQAVAKDLKEWCDETGYNLYTDGLKIITTLDSRLQAYAEEAVNKQMQVVQNNFNNHWGNTNPWVDESYREIKGFIESIARNSEAYKAYSKKFDGNEDSIFAYLNKPHRVKVFDYKEGSRYEEMSSMDSIRYMTRFMHTGFIAMEPQTGAVKAWVGDIDFNSWKYDKVTAKRQPGSTFKLFVYAAAMNAGRTPCDYEYDGYVEYDATDADGKPTKWRPHNANGYFNEVDMSLKSAFAQSINSVAVKVGMGVGIDNVISTAHSMGIKSDLTAAPAITLGACELSLIELVNGYCTVANDGITEEPMLVSKIYDRNDKLIYEAKAPNRRGLPYRSAFYMQEMLKGGLTEPGGTSMALWRFIYPFTADTDFGGKTGTSNNHSDSWFVGVTPRLVCGAWVGGEYRSIHFRTGELGQGSRTALPICGYFFEKALADEHFAHYRAKWGEPKESIDPATYTCRGCVLEAEPDSAYVADSTMISNMGDPANLVLTGRGDDEVIEDIEETE